MKIIAKTLDLDLELTDVAGKEKLYKPIKDIRSADQAEKIMKSFQDLELQIGKPGEEGKLSPASVMDAELTIVYGDCGTPSYWRLNFAFDTLRQCVEHVVNSIAGLKKSV